MQRLTAADELTQWVTSEATVSFTYASDGCLSTKSDGTDTWTYEWDYERRLKAFKKNGSTLVEYAYNPTGTRRYASDATLGVTNYFWSRGHVLGDYNSSWSLTRSYILGPRVDEIIAMINRTTDPNVTHYFTRDRLGSPRELVSASESVMTRYGYDAWGTPTESHLSGSVSTDFLYRMLLWNRYDVYLRLNPWSPKLGRTISPDRSTDLRGPLVATNGYRDNPTPLCDESYQKCLKDCEDKCKYGDHTGAGWCQHCCKFRYNVCKRSGGYLQPTWWRNQCWRDCCRPWAGPVDDEGRASTCQVDYEHATECWCFATGKIAYKGYYCGRWCKMCQFICFDLVTGDLKPQMSSLEVTFVIVYHLASCPKIVKCRTKEDQCWAGYLPTP